MPYFITDQHPDCDNWALVKEDGELVFCHPNEPAARNHMIAISLSEDLEPGGTYQGESFRSIRAEPGELSVGDFVRWQSSGGTAQGQIERIETAGEINVPNSDFTINASEEDPAALIRIYREGEDGWGPTATLVGHRFSTLTKTEPLESRDLPDNYRPSIADNVPEGRACGNCRFFNEDRISEDGTKAWCERWEDFVDGGFYCNAWEPKDDRATGLVSSYERRDVDLEAPAYMRAAARKGIELYEEGLAGDGVTEQTIREARAMARGNITADKWSRIGPWIARHMTDLDAESNKPGGEGFPGPGAVAFYLWGARPTKNGADRTREYAESITRRIESEAEGRATGKQMSKFETRVQATDFEVREEGDGMTFVGYAAIFDAPSEGLPFTERIQPGAFRRSLNSRNNIFMFYNHDPANVLASTRAGTLQLQEDSRGLRVEARLANTTIGRDVAELIRTKNLDSMSFGFSVPEGGDTWNVEGTERTLRSVRLGEVSIVARPAYPSTSGTATVRGLDAIAKRAAVDPDALADALTKIEVGEEISAEDKAIISSVITELGPKDEPETEPESEVDTMARLEMKKKKLMAMMKELQ